MSSMKQTRRTRRLASAIAGAALLTVGGAATAEPVSLTVEYTCPLPLVGDQPIIAEINTDLPAEVNVGEPTGSFVLDVITTINNDSRTGLTLVGATTIEGMAEADANVALPGGSNLPVTVPLTIPQTDIPQETGPFNVPATGETPSLTFNQAGEAQITLGDLVLDMQARDANGNLVGQPVGEFTSDCTLNAGQDTVLHTFTVVEDTPPPADPAIDVAPESVDFGTVTAGLTAEETVTISNTGGADLGINNILIQGTDASAFMQQNNCTTLAADESCAVTLTYFPSGEGAQNATLVIESGDPENPTVEVPLTGTSQLAPEPEISVDPTELNFGTVDLGNSADQSVTVTNQGDAALTINSITLGGANSGDFMQTNDCASLAADASCTVNVSFAPTAAGTRNGTLVIGSDDPDMPEVTVSLVGSGNEVGGGTIVDVNLAIMGNTVIAASDSVLPLTGSIDAMLDLATQEFTADLSLDPTQGKIALIRGFSKLAADAQVEFEQVEQTVGSLSNGTLTATAVVNVKVPKVTVPFFGFDIPIGGGEECQTSEPVTINLSSPEGETFDPLSGGNLEGVYSLPRLSNCGGLTDILNLFVAGDGNTINLELTSNL